MGTNRPETIQLSEGEQRLVNQIRQWQAETTRPLSVMVVIQDGIWHIYHGQPQGAIKPVIDKK